MSASAVPTQEPSFWKKLWRIVRTIFIIIIVVALIAAAVYFVAPFVYQEYVEPVQEHSFRLDMLAEQVQQIDQRHSERMDSLADRLQELELQNDSDKSSLASLQESLKQVDTSQSSQAESIEALLPLQTAVAEIETQLANLQSDLKEFQSVQATVEDEINNLQGNLEVLGEGQEGTAASLEAQQERLESLTAQASQVLQELQLLKIMELITRARYNLVEGNLSLSRTDIQLASEIAASLQPEALPHQVEVIAEIVNRLDNSLTNLAGSPLSTADQLEAAWQLLVQGLPGEPEETAVPEETPAPTPTP
jgi:chromosome segregation ATPase